MAGRFCSGRPLGPSRHLVCSVSIAEKYTSDHEETARDVLIRVELAKNFSGLERPQPVNVIHI
jgi:hypothetical protein